MICEACHSISSEKVVLPEDVRLYRSLDWECCRIRIVAVRRCDGVRYGKGFMVPFEFLEDTAGDLPLEEQLKDPLVRDEIDRLTILAIDSVMAKEGRVENGMAVELEWSPHYYMPAALDND